MKKGYTYYVANATLVALLFGLLVFLFSLVLGCRSTKSERVRRASAVTSVHDTVRITVRSVDTVIRERVVRDSAIGIAGGEISFVVDTFFLHDTVIRKGNLRLAVRGNKVDCSADSLVILVKNMQRESLSIIRESDSVSAANTKLQSEVWDLRYEKEVRGHGWLATVWRWLVNALAVFGVICALVIWREKEPKSGWKGL